MEPKNMDKILGIMILNWNGAQDTLECLDSLEASDYPKHNISIYVADNASGDNSIDLLTSKIDSMRSQGWRNVSLLTFDRNYGSPGGFNRIYQQIDPEVEVLVRLDNDVFLQPNCLSHLVDTLYSSSKVGIVGAQAFYFDRREVPCSGAGHIDWLSGKHNYQVPKQITECDVVMGNCIAIRRSTVEKLDYFFDEKLFIVADDLEICLQVKQQLNSKILLDPNAVCYHKGGGSTSKVNNKVTYFAFRNNILIHHRYSPKGIPQVMGYLAMLPGFFKALLLERNRFKVAGFLDGFRSRILTLDELEKRDWKTI
jgi:GT2 family glycosyltransferase